MIAKKKWERKGLFDFRHVLYSASLCHQRLTWSVHVARCCWVHHITAKRHIHVEACAKGCKFKYIEKKLIQVGQGQTGSG